MVCVAGMEIAYLTDVEGQWEKLTTFCAGNPLVSLDGDDLVVAEGATFVFGGDAIDRGPHGRVARAGRGGGGGGGVGARAQRRVGGAGGGVRPRRAGARRPPVMAARDPLSGPAPRQKGNPRARRLRAPRRRPQRPAAPAG